MKYEVKETRVKQFELLKNGVVIQKECRTCRELKLIEGFPKYSVGTTRPDCKECWKEKQKQYMDSIKDRRKVYKNRERAVKLNAPDNYSLKDYEELKEVSGGYCMISKEKVDNLQVDHFIPLSNKFGLGSIKGNLILVSEEVNRSKGDMGLLEFMYSERSRGLIDFDQLKDTLNYLAQANGMELNDYIQLVQGIDEMNKASKK
ncbi:5-methylcytosine-specific restriction endonuclease McrA [Virgibacillus natechei]|uniref:5-methylcytosine-specific restriction endonuclease McrA n=1 Tax=Virgibacillus natechei TaxID=1216297 RepID=A0ABS4IGF1_9BACI|nr:HNH endonuclease domain-containing protein [Virgibacillus natechei]MBP1970017.1 5-methylcytosine-specific restriction endonuclease McrA [Virgibacillus natechei]UZD13326.1 hypothetical protein OLD84_01820 [Virgibacillus natechei]